MRLRLLNFRTKKNSNRFTETFGKKVIRDRIYGDFGVIWETRSAIPGVQLRSKIGLGSQLLGVHGDPWGLHYTMEIQRNLGIELRVKGIHGGRPLPQFHNRIGPPETMGYYGDPEEFRNRIEGHQGLPHPKWIPYNLWRSRAILEQN